MSKLVCFNGLENELSQIGAQISAAETHGLQVGIFCGSYDLSLQASQEILVQSIGGTTLTFELEELFKRIQFDLIEQFANMNFDFQLLLPNDDCTLEERVTSLADWCHGFLAGLGLVGITEHNLNSELAHEALLDLADIAEVGLLEECTEQEELSYIELVEHIRVVVQTIHFELQMSCAKISAKNLH